MSDRWRVIITWVLGMDDITVSDAGKVIEITSETDTDWHTVPWISKTTISTTDIVTADTNMTDDYLVRGKWWTKWVQTSLVQITDTGTVNIPAGQEYQIDGTPIWWWGNGNFWKSVTWSYDTTATFTLTGTAQDAIDYKRKLFMCQDSGETLYRYWYIKSASESGGTVTCTVVSTSDLASGDKNFIISNQDNVHNHWKEVRVPGELIDDPTTNVWNWFYIKWVHIFIPIDIYVITAASGWTPECEINVFDDGSQIYTSNIELWSGATALEQRCDTDKFEIADGSLVTVRTDNQVWTTNKASDLLVKLILVPKDLFSYTAG